MRQGTCRILTTTRLWGGSRAQLAPSSLFPEAYVTVDTTKTQVLTLPLLFAPPFVEAKAGPGSGARQLHVRMNQGAGLWQGSLHKE